MSVMKQCCGLCPFSRKNTLFVHPDRAADFAYSACNPYNDFVCHKTGISVEEESFKHEEGDIVRGEKSLVCAGFYALQFSMNQRGGQKSEIKIDYDDHFGDDWEMIEHHSMKWENDKESSKAKSK